MIVNFAISAPRKLQFGVGQLSQLPSIVDRYGKRVLLVTGLHSFTASRHGEWIREQLRERAIDFRICSIGKEPSPHMVDAAVETCSSFAPDCIVAVGGGSVLDAGKAISAMLPLKQRVKDYLEGVGSKSHPGLKVPFIAIPTTAGTGSEATKNAVLSEVGVSGYKRSLRHDNFLPDLALVDPELTVGCPPAVTASSGMDAFTQLLESYLSTAANPVTDALAAEGLKRVSASLKKAFHDGADLQARADMALAAYLSGVTLANAGLGLVHGFAGPVGGTYDIPHGIICSALMAPVNTFTAQKLRATDPDSSALKKYAHVGRMFTPVVGKPDDYYVDALLSEIESMTVEMKIPKLGSLGVRKDDVPRIAAASSGKNHPVKLESGEMKEVLESALF